MKSIGIVLIIAISVGAFLTHLPGSVSGNSTVPPDENESTSDYLDHDDTSDEEQGESRLGLSSAALVGLNAAGSMIAGPAAMLFKEVTDTVGEAAMVAIGNLSAPLKRKIVDRIGAIAKKTANSLFNRDKTPLSQEAANAATNAVESSKASPDKSPSQPTIKLEIINEIRDSARSAATKEINSIINKEKGTQASANAETSDDSFSRSSLEEDDAESDGRRRRRHISSKLLLGSPYQTKDQGSFPVTGSVKSHGSTVQRVKLNHI